MFKRKSRSGSPIHRHTRTAAPRMSSGDPVARAAVTTHIERHLGPIAWTFEDPSTAWARIDVHVVAENENVPGLALVTSGMSEQLPGEPRRQPTELVICVRPGWPGMAGEPCDEEDLWPVRLLRDLARLPHQFDTHLGMGHTVPNGDPPMSYASDTRLCCALLCPALLPPDAFDELTVGDDTVEMLGVIPLHRGEMAYKLDHGSSALWDLLDEHDVSEALDPGRQSVVSS